MSFIGIKKLDIRVYNALLEEFSRTLQVAEVGLDPGFLPNLRSIAAADNLFTSFIDNRRVVGLPVEFSQQDPWLSDRVIGTSGWGAAREPKHIHRQLLR